MGGGAVTAMAAGAFEPPTPADPLAGTPRSIALSLPSGAGGESIPVPPLPDPLEGGSVSAPSSSRRIPYTSGTPTEPGDPTTLPFEFKKDGYQIVPDLPEALRPWRNRPTTWANANLSAGTYHLNADGVYMMYADDGKSYDHPVGQIQFGLGCLTSYRVETDPTRKAVFLERARAQADRLIAKRVETRGAWYFPYPFDFTHAEHSGVVYKAPWYSGMAQGESISLFAQLAALEDGLSADERALYRSAADGAFASLLRADDTNPWVVNKDQAGYLWIQEYPFKTAGTGDYTYNGMIFAMFGIWDYFRLTGNRLAAQLYDGTCTTIARHFALLRNPRWFSYYCQTHRIPTHTYHHHHIALWQQLHWHTNSPVFAHQLDMLIEDVPPGVKSGSVITIAAGTHTLSKLDTNSDGSWAKARADRVLSSKKVVFARATQAPIDVRRRIQGTGVGYRISAGAYKGHWVAEAYPNVFLRGEHLPVTYRVPRTLTLTANASVEAIDYGINGAAGTLKMLKYSKPHTLQFDRRAVVNGRPILRITSEEFAGYWIPANQVTTDGH
ncbi:D-glucuronyl C5-epimerase family protein [Streptomyces sp. NBC_01235]|uniref:D-glucuronyl C5-epimerase family protein n=1 Tax=Streptomyces sp. NBC_01235 TaxID=2903788 RepID=UPI002E1570F1|nr:D-glucuronyl C5-epimerase family protein [Streptomyces sp. NBC_01235]